MCVSSIVKRAAKKAGHRDGVSFIEARCFLFFLLFFSSFGSLLSERTSGGFLVIFIQAGCVFSKTIAVHSQESGREEVRGNEEQSSIGGDEP